MICEDEVRLLGRWMVNEVEKVSYHKQKKRGIISLRGGIPSLLSSLIIPWQPYINVG